ncbi:hypothetical protein F5ESL0233_05425 [Lactobacillus sp. ESL0233]|nr:hypothetical protein F5ESL0233_05425 [Lactobacillus sp. ESL0233]
MFKVLENEVFKTKRTIIRPITVLFPLLVMVFIILFLIRRVMCLKVRLINGAYFGLIYIWR